MLQNNFTKFFIKTKKSQGFFLGIFVVLFLVIIDQIAKIYIKTNFHFTCNQGISFGIKLPSFLFIVIWTLIMLYFLKLWFKEIENKFIEQLPFLLIIAGGLGNIIDRILYKCVVDFIPFLSWFVFNLADLFITTGVILLAIIWNFKK